MQTIKIERGEKDLKGKFNGKKDKSEFMKYNVITTFSPNESIISKSGAIYKDKRKQAKRETTVTC